jgi:hypothetical protein
MDHVSDDESLCSVTERIFIFFQKSIEHTRENNVLYHSKIL